jgi:hypothetical protein
LVTEAAPRFTRGLVWCKTALPIGTCAHRDVQAHLVV